jgi:hypothetical protein
MNQISKLMLVLLLTGVVRLPNSQAHAQLPGTVETATANLTTHTLTIQGVGFNTLLKPVVLFGSTTLPVVSYNASTVVATLPANVASGTYGLELNSLFFNCENFSITIGTTGPQGLTGATGPQGPTGAMGPQCQSARPGRLGRPEAG